MTEQKGKFIVIDGIDGSGKGTVVKSLAAYLFDKSKKNHVLLTREPYISKYHAEIRKILKESDNPREYAVLLTKLFVKDRKEHAEWIKKELNQGHIVISDRYKYSTLVYQQTQGISLELLLKMHNKISVVPDLTIILDVPADVAMCRTNNDGNRKHLEVFERVEFQKILRGKFLEIPKILKNENIVIINGNRIENRVFLSVKREVDKLF